MIEITDVELTELIKAHSLNPEGLQDVTVEALGKRKLKIATAESCTGGLISERITRVSGSSAVFDCGVCSYANHIKEQLLGVSCKTLSTLGAVSAETAIQMARGAKRISGADIGVSTTGIAGPTGGTAEKPVGLVYLGVCSEKAEFVIRLILGGKKTSPNNRDIIRKLASDAALFAAWSVCCERTEWIGA